MPYAYIRPAASCFRCNWNNLNCELRHDTHQIPRRWRCSTRRRVEASNVFKGKSQIADNYDIIRRRWHGPLPCSLDGSRALGTLMHDHNPCPRCASSRCGTLISACMAGVRELEASLCLLTRGQRLRPCTCAHSSRHSSSRRDDQEATALHSQDSQGCRWRHKPWVS